MVDDEHEEQPKTGTFLSAATDFLAARPKAVLAVLGILTATTLILMVSVATLFNSGPNKPHAPDKNQIVEDHKSKSKKQKTQSTERETDPAGSLGEATGLAPPATKARTDVAPRKTEKQKEKAPPVGMDCAIGTGKDGLDMLIRCIELFNKMDNNQSDVSK